MPKLTSVFPPRLALALGFYLANEVFDWRLQRFAAALLVVGATGAIGAMLSANPAPLRSLPLSAMAALPLLPLALTTVGALTRVITEGTAAAASLAAAAGSLWVSSAAAQANHCGGAIDSRPLMLTELAVAATAVQFVVLRAPFSLAGLAAAAVTTISAGAAVALALRALATTR